MHIGFDISQTGADKAGCGYFADAIIQALLHAEVKHRYSLFPSFGDFYLNPNMPLSNPYRGSNVTYGPVCNTREAAGSFWQDLNLEIAIGNPNIVHANNFWAPSQLNTSKLVYTLYDLGFFSGT